MSFMIAWINFIIFLICLPLWGGLYLFSLQPMKRVEKVGEKGWKQCGDVRIIAGLIYYITWANYFLWIWFPIESLQFTITNQYYISLIIGLIFLISSIPLFYFGVKSTGKETMRPNKEKKMNTGIYEYIRHPQIISDWLMFIGFAFISNSWVLLDITLLFIVVYTPIMIKKEEDDLIKRYGDEYRVYQKRTGALFPKIRKRKQ
ncbi:MAG: isoprenylcysteine carboxylmethyltransferase family protein [Promethearchaeota archaeon]|nr:MAG: isoprenylcysteine carboxylmethyltransferase family protein [Candidatus Lokiarchaeota archaeon]